MSRMNNRFQARGNLGADPEIRSIGSNGNRVAEFALAVDASYKDKDGKKVEKVEWIDYSVYAPGLIEVVEKFVKKGRELRVEGYVRKEKWESKTRKDEQGKPLTDSRYEFVVTGIELGRDPNYVNNTQEPRSAQAATDDPIDDPIPY